ncbi:aromatase/cyclase [Streptomyces mutabilis]|uniref:aromatase/cyclase n=1 Tax=Streptomyces mutabilis TaxID=67332 RepID=UPI0017809138|nr:aromatase/cyclase [Streptomyces mutabilis]GGQ49936.1 actinorhodin polyketide synthase bifunctional cyclase/dehydratase [Streptomyces mutabilis]
MQEERLRRLSHAIDVDAPAGIVYALIVSAEHRPLYFPSSVYVERLDFLDFAGASERLRVWALADGEVTSWTSDRVQDSARRSLSFRQDRLMERAASMGGTFSVQPLGPERCRLTVDHAFTSRGDSPESMAWLERNVMATTRSDLKNLRFLAEQWTRIDELTLSFEESVRTKGPAELVHGFLYDVESWPGRLPHVRRIELDEPQVGVQTVAMTLAAADGTLQDVSSVRLCFPHAGRIVYKETKPRRLLAAHCGEWSVVSDGNGVTVTSQHHVVLRENAIEHVLGPGATLQDARSRVRAELGEESLRMLHLAREYAESAVRVL